MAGERYWACYTSHNFVCAWTCAGTRKRSIEALLNDYDEGWTWDRLRKRGWSCIRVRIVPEAAAVARAGGSS